MPFDRPTEVFQTPRDELIRKGVHSATGALLLLLRWVEPLVLAPVAAAGIAFNTLLLPRLRGWRLWRPGERAAGSAPAVVAYPVSVLILLLVFHRRPEVVVVGWGLLAFGDGAAAIGGRLWGRGRLPWNRDKTWIGLVSFWFGGTLAVWCLLSWVTGTLPLDGYRLSGVAITALVAALFESSSQRLDDNITVPLISALLFLCLEESAGGWSRLWEDDTLSRMSAALAINLVLAGIGWRIRGLSRSGAAAAVVVGATILWLAGVEGYACLVAFFVIGTTVTRIGRRSKIARGVAEPRGGRRSAAKVLANGGVAAVCSLFAVVAAPSQLFVFAFVTSLAAACADTVESELGQVWGRPTVLISTWRSVSPGVDGGVSPLGTAAGFGAALVVAALAAGVGLIDRSAMLPIASAALLATLLESVVGATVERRGLLTNQGVNLFNTLVAALLGAGIGWMVA